MYDDSSVSNNVCSSLDVASSISIAPVNVIADLGSQTRLGCSTVSNASSISWEFVAEKLDDQDAPVTIVTGCAVPEDYRQFYDVNSTSVGQCDLVIPSVTSKHVGIYTCKDSTASRSAIFGVIGEFGLSYMFRCWYISCGDSEFINNYIWQCIQNQNKVISDNDFVLIEAVINDLQEIVKCSL